MGHWAGLHKLLVHISLKGQLLHVDIMTQGHKSFATFVGTIIRILHRAQNPEHLLMCAHEKLTRQLQVFDATGRARLLDRKAICGHSGTSLF